MRELSKVGHPNSVLSISPPRFVVGELKEIIFWLKTKKSIEKSCKYYSVENLTWVLFVALQALLKSLREFLIEKLMALEKF